MNWQLPPCESLEPSALKCETAWRPHWVSIPGGQGISPGLCSQHNELSAALDRTYFTSIKKKGTSHISFSIFAQAMLMMSCFITSI